MQILPRTPPGESSDPHSAIITSTTFRDDSRNQWFDPGGWRIGDEAGSHVKPSFSVEPGDFSSRLSPTTVQSSYSIVTPS